MASPARCNPEAIQDFLTDRLDVAQQSEFERHLDECDACCRELQHCTADVALWDDARTFLSSTDVATAAATLPEGTQPLSVDMLRLDFLAPTDDPFMLGRFGGCEISGVIGCGGMGIVLKALDSALNRYSAIKVLAPHFASSGAARQRFAREAQAAAAVVHDNVVGIHGVAECSGLPYLVMPYIKGTSLQKRIDREGPLSTAEVLRIAMQTARGLAAAHDQGLVHRDIKPANILLPDNVERVMITDFGLARAADDASLTRSGVIAGTPQYMSPEQARGDAVDIRSDLFSLGSVMYAMCTGHPPFRAETSYGVLRRITDAEPRPIREVNPQMPPWLVQIICRLLAKDPSQRYSSPRVVADLLEDCLAHVQQPEVVPLPTQFQQVPKSRWWPPLLAGAAMAAILWLYWLRDGNDQLSTDFDGSSPAETIPQLNHGADGDPAKSDASANAGSRPDELAADISEADLRWWPDDELDRIEKTLSELRTELAELPSESSPTTPAVDVE